MESKILDSEKGNYRIENPQEPEIINDVGAPPLVIVVQGGKKVFTN